MTKNFENFCKIIQYGFNNKLYVKNPNLDFIKGFCNIVEEHQHYFSQYNKKPFMAIVLFKQMSFGGIEYILVKKDLKHPGNKLVLFFKHKDVEKVYKFYFSTEGYSMSCSSNYFSFKKYQNKLFNILFKGISGMVGDTI